VEALITLHLVFRLFYKGFENLDHVGLLYLIIYATPDEYTMGICFCRGGVKASLSLFYRLRLYLCTFRIGDQCSPGL